MSRKSATSRVALEQRYERVEELLLSGIAPSRIETSLSKEYGITTRQVRNYITEVYERWQERRQTDAPYRRERVFLMAERFYAKAMADKRYGPAAQILGLLMKASGAFQQDDAHRDRLVAELGPPPTEPTAVLVWAQKAMAFELYNVLTNSALDPERKLRWIAELGGKLGMTHAKVLVESKLALIEAHAGLDTPAGSALPPPPQDPDGSRDRGPPQPA